jgi:hypothetical protein
VDSVLIGIVISEGIGFIAVLIKVSYQAGKVFQWMKTAEYRIAQLEADSHTHNPGSDVKKGGVSKDYGKKSRI